VGFHLWHLARWADFFIEMVRGPGSQIWDREALARQWGLSESPWSLEREAPAVGEHTLEVSSVEAPQPALAPRRETSVVDR